MFTVTPTINHKVSQFTGNLYTEELFKVLAYAEQGKRETKKEKGGMKEDGIYHQACECWVLRDPEYICQPRPEH